MSPGAVASPGSLPTAPHRPWMRSLICSITDPEFVREPGGTAIVVTSDPHYIRALRNYRDAGIHAFGWVGGIG